VTRLSRHLLPVLAAALVAASSAQAQETRGVTLESRKPFAALSA